jgi:hypothetical protein
MASKFNPLSLADKLRGSNPDSLLPFQAKAKKQIAENEKFSTQRVPKIFSKPKPKKKGFEKGTIPKVEDALRKAGA